MVRGTPHVGDNGEILKWFGTCTDIDQIKQSEAEIKLLNENLEIQILDRTRQLETTNK